MTQIITHLHEISDQYKALFVDLWGCVHNGKTPFPGAVDALMAYRERGGIVVLLTNAPRHRHSVAEQLAQIGVPEDCWTRSPPRAIVRARPCIRVLWAKRSISSATRMIRAFSTR
jgi:ribonucleotide monophosphatase NagD (HAD superfamily)